MTSTPCSHLNRVALLLTLAVFLGGPLRAAEPKQPGTLDEKAFVRPELKLSTSQVPLEKVMSALPNREAWEQLLAGDPAREPRDQRRLTVYIDPRSGAATNIVGAFPLVPGRGVGNRVTLASLGEGLGRPVASVDSRTVGEVFRRFALRHRGVLNIDVQQLGEVRATQVSLELWQIHVPQEYNGVLVRDARLAGSVNNGNLVVVGTEVWGDVKDLDVTPRVGAEEALEAGFAYVDGRRASDFVEREPTLEIVPVAPPEQESDEAFVGPLGSGYGHWLVWTFVFRREFDQARWEVMVDAHSGEVVALQDINQYGEVKGGVYPLTNTEVCPDPERCGTLQSNTPMPFANTGLAAPNNFTTSAGLYDSAGGNATTTLAGRYIRVVDNCGAISVGSGSPTVDLGGINGQHDCTSAGASPGNTSSSRSSFYELNRIAEMARGWLPSNTWLQSQLTGNVNIVDICNAYWDGSTVNFFRSGGGCRNTGEIAAVFDHEWGHGLDDNDAAGVLSNSSEAYADIAAIYRLNASCVGYGFFWTSNKSCGQTSDGTGFNQNENQVGGLHCDLDCSGVRDADWDKHSDHLPDTALGFVCGQCTTGSGPCGRQVHCAAAPARQAAWDLVARDLQAAPYNLDAQTALIVGNRLFYQGSGNIGLWHSCSCGVSSDGCGATNGYMQWLTADDDNGNLADGTPHMIAIYNAFNRHGIACNTPAPQTSGCAGAPTQAPSLTATPGVGQNQLSWTTVAGATKYRVFRAEGPAACELGKTLVAEVTGAEYTDAAVANGRDYGYNVMAVGASAACASPASPCLTATPSTGPEFAIACSPSSLTFPVGGGSSTSTCSITSVAGFAGEAALDCTNLPAEASCGYAPASVTVPAGGSATSTLTVTTTATTPAGTQTFKARGVSGAMTRTFGMSLSVPVPDFTLACSPFTLTVPLGGMGSSTCTVTSANGFASPVDLSCFNLPAGVTCGYSPNPAVPPADGSVSSALTVAVAPTALPGTYTIQARGVGAGLSRAYALTLRIPDFTLACSPTSLTIPAGGGSRTSTCTVTSLLDFAGAVSLDCANLPSGASCSYVPASVTPPVNGSATSTLTLTTTAAIPVGTYSFQGRGVSGPRTRTVSMTLSVAPPDFSLGCSPSTLTVPLGASGSGTCTVTATNGFVAPTTLGCSGLPAGATCVYTPNPVIPPGVGSVVSSLTVAVSPTTLPGAYSIQATAVGGGLSRAYSMTLRIPDFTLSCSPSSMTIPVGGGSRTSTCTITSVRDFAGAVALDCASLPFGASCSYAPASVTPPLNGSTTSTLTVTTTAAAPVGTYTFEARGVSGPRTRTASMALSVAAPDFTLGCSPSGLTIPLGGTGSGSCSVTATNGFVAPTTLGCSGLPAGVTCGYTPNPVIPPGVGSVASTLSVGVSPTALPGTYPIQATASGGGLTRTYNMTLNIPEFTIACSPGSLVVPAGGSNTSACTLSSVNGFSSPVSLSCVNLPAGVTCAAVPNPATPSVTSTLTVAVSGSTPAGSYPFQVQGIGGGLTKVYPITLDVRGVAAAFDPTLKTPRCGAVSSLCDSGSLLVGRAGLGPEPNQPNTIGGSCGDGAVGTFHSDESNDRLIVSTLDGGRFSAGKTVRIEARVWAWTSYANDKLDLYYAADAASPTWSYLATLTPGTGGAQTLSANYTLPAGSLQAVRAVFRYLGAAAPCFNPVGSFDDRDDLVFAVNRPPVAQVGGPYGGVRHQAIAFDGTASSDSNGDPLTYAWDFGDGTTGTGPTPTHAYASVGNYTVTLVVNDGTDSSAPSTTTATISNQAPVANAGPPRTGVRNTSVAFDGTASSDPDGDPLTYQWTFGDGAMDSDPTPSHGYTSLGSFTVTLVVNDGTIDSAPSTTTVTIENRPPVAAAGGPYTAFRNQEITFTGAGSSDPDGDSLTYQWTFGDGATGSGPSPTHAYTTLGSHTVTLVVNDGTADSAPATATATIQNQPPVAVAGGPYASVRNQAITFSGTGSSDPDGDPLTYQWTFGDGATGSGPTPTHAYGSLGSFTATLVVNDGTASSPPASATVTINNLPPTTSLTTPPDGTVVTAPALVTLGASAADPDGTIARVEFFVGAAKIGESVGLPYTTTWAASVPGTYALTARATDESGTSTTSTPVSVLVNAPPSATLTSPAPDAVFAAPASITLSATAADPDGQVARVDFYQGTTLLGSDATAPYTWALTNVAAGAYSFTARAVDDRGAATSSPAVVVKVESHRVSAADAYVRDGSSNAGKNFGTATTLIVKKGSSGSNRWSYLRFDTSVLVSVSRVRLRLFGRLSATTSTVVTASVYPVANMTWGETQITWNNKPASGATPLAATVVDNQTTTERWYEWDVTAYVQQEKAAGRHVVTLVLKNDANSSPTDNFHAREAASQRPELVLTP